MGRSEPLFTVRHEVEIDASPARVWEVLSDTASYGDWNPYVLSIEGVLAPGEVLRVTINQANWPAPITVEPTVMRVQPCRVLHWQGQLGDGGVLDTDHVFEIHDLGGGRARFDHYEVFGGEMAERMDDEGRAHIEAAFASMNQALASRATG